MAAESLEPELNDAAEKHPLSGQQIFSFHCSATNSEDYVPNPRDGFVVCLSRSSHLCRETARLRKEPQDGSEEKHIVLINFTS